jgi:hypothetical protein
MRECFVRGGLGAAALVLAGGLLAHEGHEHRVMGTVAAVESARLAVTDRDGKKVEILLSADTKYKRGKDPAGASDVKVGERVVIIYTEEGEQKKAKEVLLSTTPPAKPAPK